MAEPPRPSGRRPPSPQSPRAPLSPAAGAGAGARPRCRSCPRRAGPDSPGFRRRLDERRGRAPRRGGCPVPSCSTGCWGAFPPLGGRGGTVAEGTRCRPTRKRLLGRFLPQEGPSPTAEPGSALLPDLARPPWAVGWGPHYGGPTGAALSCFFFSTHPRKFCWVGGHVPSPPST